MGQVDFSKTEKCSSIKFHDKVYFVYMLENISHSFQLSTNGFSSVDLHISVSKTNEWQNYKWIMNFNAIKKLLTFKCMGLGGGWWVWGERVSKMLTF